MTTAEAEISCQESVISGASQESTDASVEKCPTTPTSTRPSRSTDEPTEDIPGQSRLNTHLNMTAVRRHIDFDNNDPIVKMEVSTDDEIDCSSVESLPQDSSGAKNSVVPKRQSLIVLAARTRLQQKLSSLVTGTSQQVYHKQRTLPDPLQELQKKENVAGQSKQGAAGDVSKLKQNNPFGIHIRDPEEISDIEYSSETEGKPS